MGYKNEKAPSNGSFLVKSTGAIEFYGVGSSDKNQIATFDPEDSALTSTNLADLFSQFFVFFCVSQYKSNSPNKRPDGDELELGDLWTDSDTDVIHVWDTTEWIPINGANGVSVGSIINSINPAVPTGYLRCDGSTCPPQYSKLRALLSNDILPTRPQVSENYNYIKF